MFYEKTLVRWDLPRVVKKEKGFVLQNAGGKTVYENAPGSLQSSYNNLTLCNHITLVWDRDGFEVCLFRYKLPRNYYRGS